MRRILALSIALLMGLSFASCDSDSSKGYVETMQDYAEDARQTSVDSNAKYIYNAASTALVDFETKGILNNDGEYTDASTGDFMDEVKKNIGSNLEYQDYFDSYTFSVSNNSVLGVTYKDTCGTVGNYPSK